MIQSIFHNVTNHIQIEDNRFEREFRDLTLDPALFNHEAHIRLAWIHIKKYGPDKARVNICKQISLFDKTFGDGTKYDKKLTEGSIRLIDHHIKKSNSTDFVSFINEFPELKTDFLSLVKKWI